MTIIKYLKFSNYTFHIQTNYSAPLASSVPKLHLKFCPVGRMAAVLATGTLTLTLDATACDLPNEKFGARPATGTTTDTFPLVVVVTEPS